ncbi:MAG: hypothetical protein ACLQDY_17300 [Streptosporangiaceae bacterium]
MLAFIRRPVTEPGGRHRVRPAGPGPVFRIGSATCVALCAAAMVAPTAWAGPAAGLAHAAPSSARSRLLRPARSSRPADAARPAGSPYTVSTMADAGAGSLRAAIQQADSSGSPSVINFSISGTITLSSALPAVTADVSIDGTTAPGNSAGAAPVVAINCRGHAGLLFAVGSRGSELLGVAVDNASGNGVTLSAGDITLNSDYIGLTPNGQAAGNRGDGVFLSAGSSGDHVGLNSSGDPGTVANVISGNGGSGVVLSGSSNDVVAANRIGTSPAGTSARGNGGSGIMITGRADSNEIGGTDYTDPKTGQANNPTGSKGTVTPVFIVPALGNLISGNNGNGVLIKNGPRGTMLNGNFIGTTASGDAALGNGGNGVLIDHASRNSLTGCKFVNNPFVYYNVISANRQNGVRITDSGNVVVQGNFFGIAANNTTLLGNRRDGILVDGNSKNTQVGGVIPLGNVSAGNGANGIEVTGRVHGFITFNTFGGLLAFKGAAPNGRDGLLITSTGGDNLVRTNVFSGNRGNGIELAGRATGVTVDPDIAGLTTNGKTALPNHGDGLLIDGRAHGNVIGGTLRSVIPQDTFSGNYGYGIAIAGHAHGNRVFTSFVGTKILGAERQPNHRGGVWIGGRAYRNTLGDRGRLPANIISGNIGNGVTLGPGTTGNSVIRNYIGLGRLGRSLPNTGRAVRNRGHRNTIRGNRAQPRR